MILRLNPRFQKGEWVQWMQEMPPGSPPELLKAAETFSNLVVDGIFHAYLYIAGYGYSTTVGASWLAPLVEAAQTQFLDISFLM